MRLIFRKGKTARQHFNQELNKKKREENAKRKNSCFIGKNRYHAINTEKSSKIRKFLNKKAKQK
jgi:hypothetical protein